MLGSHELRRVCPGEDYAMMVLPRAQTGEDEEGPFRLSHKNQWGRDRNSFGSMEEGMPEM